MKHIGKHIIYLQHWCCWKASIASLPLKRGWKHTVTGDNKMCFSCADCQTFGCYSSLHVSLSADLLCFAFNPTRAVAVLKRFLSSVRQYQTKSVCWDLSKIRVSLQFLILQLFTSLLTFILLSDIFLSFISSPFYTHLGILSLFLLRPSSSRSPSLFFFSSALSG